MNALTEWSRNEKRYEKTQRVLHEQVPVILKRLQHQSGGGKLRRTEDLLGISTERRLAIRYNLRVMINVDMGLTIPVIICRCDTLLSVL